jgi:hypothetical protein
MLERKMFPTFPFLSLLDWANPAAAKKFWPGMLKSKGPKLVLLLPLVYAAGEKSEGIASGIIKCRVRSSPGKISLGVFLVRIVS